MNSGSSEAWFCRWCDEWMPEKCDIEGHVSYQDRSDIALLNKLDRLIEVVAETRDRLPL